MKQNKDEKTTVVWPKITRKVHQREWKWTISGRRE